MVNIKGSMATLVLTVLVMAGSGCVRNGTAKDKEATASAKSATPSTAVRQLDCATIMEQVSIECDGFVAVAPGSGPRPELRYRPAEMVACMESDRGADLRQRASPYSSSEEYILMVPRIMPLPKQVGEGAKLLSYLDQGLRSDLYEVIGPDTLQCAFSHVESSAASAPDITVLLGFDRPQDGSERTLLLRDREGFFGGDLHFTFKHGAFKAYHRLVTSDQG